MTISVPKLFSLARMTTATTGTGPITLGSAATVNSVTYLTFAQAGVSDGDIVSYAIADTNASEYGYGTYTASGTTLTRTVIRSTNSNSALNLSGSAQVFITAGNAELLWGFDTARNFSLSASVAANVLTVSMKDANGNDPSVNSPVIIPFRSATASTGQPDIIAVRSALSVDTNTTGATLATANNVPFRFWVVVFNDSVTPAMALWQSVTGGATPTAIAALDEGTPQSSTAMSGSATSAGTFYTKNGTTVTSKAFRILGYIEYASGLATAGTYASVPTKIQLFGPGIKKPGDVMQHLYQSTTTQTTSTSASYQITDSQLNIRLTSAANIVECQATGAIESASGNVGFALANFGLFRNATQFGSVGGVYNASAVDTALSAVMYGLDAPGTTSSTTYSVKVLSNGSATMRWCLGSQPSVIMVKEIMA